MQISKTFKDEEVLKNCSWEVKKGERVGLVGLSLQMHRSLYIMLCVDWLGMNGAGKTTQLQIIAGTVEADSGNVVKSKADLKIAYLTQEFDVVPSRTVREEFTAAYDEQLRVCRILSHTFGDVTDRLVRCWNDRKLFSWNWSRA